MFQNISFTFLCALAFISWSLLCYLHAIEELPTKSDYNVELYTERPTVTDVPNYCPSQPEQNNIIDRLFDMLKTYGLVLITTVAFSKLLQWLELQAKACMKKDEEILALPFIANIPREPIEPIQENNNKVEIVETMNTVEKGDPMDTVENVDAVETMESTETLVALDTVETVDSEERIEGVKTVETVEKTKIVEKPESSPTILKENIELREQLNDLQARCRELLQELRAANSNSTSSCHELRRNPSNSSFSGSDTDKFHNTDDSSGVVMWKQPATMKSSGLSVVQCRESSSSTAQNVYVTHSHYHINFNGPVHLTKQNINIGISSRPKKLRRRSEFLQVWGTFIKGPNERPMLTGINNILM